MIKNRSDYADVESRVQVHELDAELDADSDLTLVLNQPRTGSLGEMPGAAENKRVKRTTMPEYLTVKPGC